MNKGHAFIAVAVLVLAGVVWFVFKGESCASWQERDTKAFAESMYGDRAADERWNLVRSQRPEGC